MSFQDVGRTSISNEGTWYVRIYQVVGGSSDVVMVPDKSVTTMEKAFARANTIVRGLSPWGDFDVKNWKFVEIVHYNGDKVDFRARIGEDV